MTPAYRQYSQIKKQYPDCVLLFQLGDFYETFDEDAKAIATACDIVLTSRDFGRNGKRPLAGFPVRSADGHIARLIAAGHKVVVVDQVQQTGGAGSTLKNATAAAARGGHGEKLKSSSKLFDRVVSRVITPGTILDPAMLDAKTNNYLVAAIIDTNRAGVAYADVSTGEFACLQVAAERLPFEIQRLAPAELLVPGDGKHEAVTGLPAVLSQRDSSHFELGGARDAILKHFGVATVEPFGCADLPLAIRAAGALLTYLKETQRRAVGLVSRLVTVSSERTMLLDAPTRRNLELSQTGRTIAGRPHPGTLLSVIDLTRTPMGGRLLRRWLYAPLLDLDPLHDRLEAVSAFYEDGLRRAQTIAELGHFSDIERLLQRVSSGQAGPRELVALRRSLEVVPSIAAALFGDAVLGPVAGRLDRCIETVTLIARAIRDDPPPTTGDGGVIRPGYSEELDALALAGKDGRAYIAGLERQERERSGIGSLKVGFNKVFGYYLEVSHSNLSRVPDHYIRKQTLVGAERYITPEMKEVEALVLQSQEKIVGLESELYREVCHQVASAADRIRSTATAIAEIDVYSSFAEVAVRRGYCRPVLDNSDQIAIRAGRHPVVEAALDDDRFVPNDVDLSSTEAQIVVLTGPNMAGKSVYIRQVALQVLLAQVGSFVPADQARIGLVDRIFSRVGAQDDMASGQSTFMVEMAETANILHHATHRSLIILDEIGRGTSTYDGMAIARSIVEHLHDHPRLGSKTLFATHYHELATLEASLPRVRNYRMEVLEEGDRVVFLHRVVPGGADRSYGLYVARLAGIPRAVVGRAEEILRELEARALTSPSTRKPKDRKQTGQLSLLPLGGNLVEELATLDVDGLTPLEAIRKLYELRSRAAAAFRHVT